jgi:hypothetical protein
VLLLHKVLQLIMHGLFLLIYWLLTLMENQTLLKIQNQRKVVLHKKVQLNKILNKFLMNKINNKILMECKLHDLKRQRMMMEQLDLLKHKDMILHNSKKFIKMVKIKILNQ